MNKKLLLYLLAFIWFAGYGARAETHSAADYSGDEQEKQQISLKEYLKEIETRFNVSFGFANKTIENKNVKSGQNQYATIDEALKIVLGPLGLTYKEVYEDFYVIHDESADPGEIDKIKPAKTEEENDKTESKPELNRGTKKALSMKQDITVRGKVTSLEDSEPLPGVNVILKETTTGTTTDIDGNYAIEVPSADAVLVFSSIGYTKEEIPVNGRSVIDLALAPDIQTLSEVVVVGYGEQKRTNLTGSVASIEAEEIENIPVGNLAMTLQGRLAGVKVGQSTGKPGAANPISIRTTSSYGAPESILYVIDGVIYDNDPEQFNRLDPSEVESISILKDASAAIYGARASGGVVLVKTKRGKQGKPTIRYSSSVGIGNPTQLPHMLSPGEHARMLNEMYDHENGKYRNDPGYENNKRRDFRYFTEDELAAADTLNYDWLDGLYKDAYRIRHTLNVSGGNENVTYFIGGSYYDEKGNIDNLFYKKYSFRANLEAEVAKDLTFTLGLSTNRGANKEPYYAEDDQPGVLRGAYQRLLTAPGWIPPTIDDYPVFVSGTWNPYGLMQSNNYKAGSSNNTNIMGALEYKIPAIEGLTLKAQLSFNESSGRGKRFAQDYTVYNFVKAGENKHIYTNELSTSNPEQTIGNREALNESSSHSQFYQLNTSLNYKRSFGAHNIDALLIYEQSESEGSNFDILKNVADIKGYDQLWAFTNNGIEAGSNASESGRLAYIGRLNYDYAGKYLFETAFRYEASQIFHPDYAWGFFPSISAGWVISEENFFRDNVSLMNFVKLRASVGRIGNDNVGAFQWKQTYGANEDGPLFGTTLTNAIDVKNNGIYTPTLTWQKTDHYNVGLDTRFMRNRVNFSADYYYKYTFDILDRRNSSPTTLGVDKPPHENYGIMFANGLEFQLGYTDKIGSEFQYSFNGNFSWDYARRLKVIQNPAVIGRWDDYLKNHPSNQPGWIALGMIRTQEDLDNVRSMYDSISGVPVEMGMIYYKDIRGENYSEGPDGKLDGWDKTIIADYTSPPYNYGFSFGFSWKGLKANGTFSGRFGHKEFISKEEQVLPSENSNVFAFWGDYWTPDNLDASMPRPYDFGLMEQHSTFWMRDGHTLRLSNVSLSYDLPANLLERWKLPQFSVYFTGTNMWTVISPFDYKDPSVSRAYDYPLTRSYNFGLNVDL